MRFLLPVILILAGLFMVSYSFVVAHAVAIWEVQEAKSIRPEAVSVSTQLPPGFEQYERLPGRISVGFVKLVKDGQTATAWRRAFARFDLPTGVRIDSAVLTWSWGHPGEVTYHTLTAEMYRVAPWETASWSEHFEELLASREFRPSASEERVESLDVTDLVGSLVDAGEDLYLGFKVVEEYQFTSDVSETISVRMRRYGRYPSIKLDISYTEFHEVYNLTLEARNIEGETLPGVVTSRGRPCPAWS